MLILVTGATGFVGRQIVTHLLKSTTVSLRLVLRADKFYAPSERVSTIRLPGLLHEMDWQAGLTGCEVVIHAAARVHVMKEPLADPLHHYRETNVHATLKLARQAATAKVKRFIFISSIKVNGEETQDGQLYQPDDQVDPCDPYALSKREAELGLLQIANETGMEVVIIRSPLVYGPGVKGNFLKIMKWIRHGIPLPLGKINNKRSFVSVYNLVDLIEVCITHPQAANQIFLVSDGEDISTSVLLKRIAQAMGKSARFMPIPHVIIFSVARLFGKKEVLRRLFGSLELDISKTCTMLDWQPKRHMDEVLKEMVEQ